MSDTLQTFVFDGEEPRPIRVVMQDGEPWFVAKDVCAAIGIQDHRSAIQPLDDDEKGVETFHSPGGAQDMIVVSESGLYALALRSQAAIRPGSPAHRFRKWVTAEVLPQIRKTGHYAGEPLDPTEGWPWELIGQKLQLVREVRLTCGQKAAAALAARIGLPGVEPLPGAKASSAVAQGIDFVRQFLAERVEDAPGGRVQASVLFEAFKFWARENDLPPMTSAGFGRTLIALGMRRSDSERYRYYVGIRLKHLSEVTG